MGSNSYFSAMAATVAAQSGAFEVGDHTAANTHDVVWVRTKVVVPCSCCIPYLVVLQQVGINEHKQLLRVTEGRNTTSEFGNPILDRLTGWS